MYAIRSHACWCILRSHSFHQCTATPISIIQVSLHASIRTINACVILLQTSWQLWTDIYRRCVIGALNWISIIKWSAKEAIVIPFARWDILCNAWRWWSSAWRCDTFTIWAVSIWSLCEPIFHVLLQEGRIDCDYAQDRKRIPCYLCQHVRGTGVDLRFVRAVCHEVDCRVVAPLSRLQFVILRHGVFAKSCSFCSPRGF